MSKLPAAIQRQVDAVEEMYRQPAQATEPTAEAVETAAAPVESAEPAPAVPAAPETVQAAPEPEAPAAAPAPQEEPDIWERRYKTLQGVHRRNVDDLKAQIAAQNATMAELRKELAEAKASKAPSIDPKDAETFGEDLMAAVNRIVEARLAHANAQYDHRLAALDSRIEGASTAAARTAEDLFLERLGHVVPDYQALDKDEGFLDWLAQADEVYGEPRQTALNRAVQALDSARAAAIFNAYKATQTARPAAAPAKKGLERHVAPSASSSQPVQQAPAARTYSAAEVTKFYDDVTKGRYAGRMDEMKREEAAINAALAEGRIR